MPLRFQACAPGLDIASYCLRWTIPSHQSPGSIKRVAGCEAIQGQKRNFVLPSDCTLMFLHARDKPTASFAQKDSEALRARNLTHNVPRWKRVLLVYLCSLERFRWLVGDGEVVGTSMSGDQFRYSLDVMQGSPLCLGVSFPVVWGSWKWSLFQGTFYESEWVPVVGEEPLQVGYLLPTSRIKMNHGLIAFYELSIPEAHVWVAVFFPLMSYTVF